MRKFNVTVNGNKYEVCVEEAGIKPNFNVVSAPVVGDGEDAKITPAKQPAPTPVQEAPASLGDGVKVNAPMPGLVLRYAVEEGAKVKKNDKILIVEAMKMETDVLASADGVVSFAVKVGDFIESGTVIAVIK